MNIVIMVTFLILNMWMMMTVEKQESRIFPACMTYSELLSIK